MNSIPVRPRSRTFPVANITHFRKSILFYLRKLTITFRGQCLRPTFFASSTEVYHKCGHFRFWYQWENLVSTFFLASLSRNAFIFIISKWQKFSSALFQSMLTGIMGKRLISHSSLVLTLSPSGHNEFSKWRCTLYFTRSEYIKSVPATCYWKLVLLLDNSDLYASISGKSSLWVSLKCSLENSLFVFVSLIWIDCLPFGFIHNLHNLLFK